MIKVFINKLKDIRSVDIWTAYSDFMEIAAYTLKKPFEFVYKENIDNEFNNILKKYNDNEKEIFTNLLGIFINLMDEEASRGKFTDIAGEIFNLLNIANKQAGQFFTPQNLGYLTANVMDKNNIKKIIDEQGYMTLNEPACGTGSMILGMATLLLELGYNPQKKLLIKAVDIDRRCVDMCFTQLGYYGFPAVVTHGDTLSRKEWKKQYTPIYILDLWYLKRSNL